MLAGYILCAPVRRILTPTTRRAFTTTGHRNSYVRVTATAGESRSWLSDTKARIGKLLFHGATAEEVREIDVILKKLTKSWREYISGSEGFLTSSKWRGLFRHHVVWGDMVRSVL
jgi:hypothetical protein